jgi:hypothetical protein
MGTIVTSSATCSIVTTKIIVGETCMCSELLRSVGLGQGKAINAVKLLETDTPFMQQSGARRVRRLALTGLVNESLLREGAPVKLVALLDKGGDQGLFLC